ncbi:MAG: type II toxin-antitoxin system death-on-curing family toxin [Gordonia sp. (in: high G+C Gram-positive bacteria)]|uniref:type II toxin-antitoxin system death-on-curing family toxin n=1 Tax=Gordonia sp. (in: high G+C Gram-positive bacteria) TaxID=84139 RepID=UPI0039E5E76C
MTDYLTLDDALLVAHEFGFIVGDAGLLASALARPATTVFGKDAYATLSRKAAALLESVVRNHPFIDGNKRTGWTLMVTFCFLNGYIHDFTTDEGYDLVIGIAEARVYLDAAEQAIVAHLVPR